MNLAMDLIREALLGGSGGGGGGGGSVATLLKTLDLGHVTSSSTTAADIGKTITLENVADKYDLILVYSLSDAVPGAGQNVHVSTLTIIVCTYYSGSYAVSALTSSNVNVKKGASPRTATSNQGVFFAPAITGTTITLTGKVQYNSNYTGTLDGNYIAYVYGLKFDE